LILQALHPSRNAMLCGLGTPDVIPIETLRSKMELLDAFKN
jgi:hypothetical protein